MGIGIFTKSTAEYAKRGEDFNKASHSPQWLGLVAAPCTTLLVCACPRPLELNKRPV